MWKDEYRKLIKTLTFSNDLSNMPTNCTEENLCWNISDESSAYPVYHYLVQNQTDTTKYDAYIVSEKKIYAPKDSFALFNLSNYESNSYVSNLESINFNNNFNTSKVRNMSGMFEQLVNLKSIDVSNFNTSKAVNMRALFYRCESLTELDVSNFDTSKVTDMGWLFAQCTSLTNLNLSSFNTSNVTGMTSMFYICKSLTNLDLSNFNTSNVTTMNGMFYMCQSLTRLDVSNFDTSKVTYVTGMFYCCLLLTSLDVSNFNTSNVINMRLMFNTCKSLISLDLSSFDTSKVTDMYAMFTNCLKIQTEISIMNANTTSYSYMFTNAATEPGAKITINYTSETESLVDQMILRKSSNSNVVKGKQL